MSYDPATRALSVGAGSISPVWPEVWEYRIGGVQVLRKWFGFRKRRPDVEWQTPLNEILPLEWPARWVIDLLDLIKGPRAPRASRRTPGAGQGTFDFPD